jgi:protein gp37
VGDDSKIEWTDRTWNFIHGCTKVSEGCLNCYIERTIPFRIAGMRFDKAGIGGTTGLRILEHQLTLPLRLNRSRMIFPNSLSDWLHPAVPDEIIIKAFAVMAIAQWHIFQPLSKRHARMRSLFSRPDFRQQVEDAAHALARDESTPLTRPQRRRVLANAAACTLTWPLSNVWMGASAEDDATALLRLPALCDTPAAVRWVSCEPLLGPLDILHPFLVPGLDCGCERGATVCDPTIDWVVIGGESGPPAKATELDTRPAPGLRDMDLEWVRSLIAQCRAASVPVFVKQLGEPWARRVGAKHRKGGDWDEWPAEFRVREYPHINQSERVA